MVRSFVPDTSDESAPQLTTLLMERYEQRQHCTCICHL